jgi:glutathione S-transferase
MKKHIIYHIPVCPFSQRVEILLELKGKSHEVDFQTVDVTKPRSPELLQKTRGTTSLPVLETPDGKIIKESLVILQYFEDLFLDNPVAKKNPYQRAVENMMIKMEADFGMKGYLFVMNQDLNRREELKNALLKEYQRLNDFLMEHAPNSTFLFDKFGWVETVFTPFFMRFWFIEYYEDFELPDDEKYSRVAQWIEACLHHPAAQQVTREQIIKTYYDYAKGFGNGSLPTGRSHSSFAFEPHWKNRPMPPKDKYTKSATDEELGLI